MKTKLAKLTLTKRIEILMFVRVGLNGGNRRTIPPEFGVRDANQIVPQIFKQKRRPFGHNRHGPKAGGCALLEGELGPHLTQCRRAEAYLAS